MKMLRNHQRLHASLMLVLLAFWQIAHPLQGSTYTWTPTSAGTFDWTSSANWNPTTGIPNGLEHIANLSSELSGAQTINLNRIITLGTLNIGAASGTNSFTLAAGAGGYLILDVSSGSALISKTSGGADIISTALQFNDNLSITNSSASLLTLSGAMRSLSSGLTVGGSGDTTISGVISTSGGLIKEGSGLLNLSAANTFAGTTAINGGTLRVSSATGLPIRSAVTVGADGVLDMNQAFTIGSLSGSGLIDNTSATNRVITIGRDDTSTTFTGTISPATAARVAVTKIGAGTLTLAPTLASTYTGNTIINGGGINLDFANTALTSLLAATPLQITGGNFTMTGKAGLAANQQMGALTVGATGGAITLVAGDAAGTTLRTGPVTATASGGTLLITAPTNTAFQMGTAYANVGTSGTTGLNNRLVFSDGTANTFNWASNGGVANANTVGFIPTVALPVSGGGLTTTAYLLTASQTQTTAASTIRSLKLSSSGNGPQTLNLATFNMTLGGTATASPGAILIDGTDAWNINSSTGVLGQATAAGGDLIFHQYSPGGVTVNAGITNGAGTLNLVKAGTGLLTLAGSNTFTGTIFVNEGILSFNNAGASGAGTLGLGVGTAVTIRDGATLQYTGATATMAAATTANSHTFALSGGNGTISVTNAATVLQLDGVISGAGSLVKSGAGTLTLGAAATHTGSTMIMAGTLRNSAADRVPTTPTFINTGAIWDISAGGDTVGTIFGGGEISAGTTVRALVVGGDHASTMTTDGINSFTSFTGSFTGAAAHTLTKTGSGVFTIASATTSAWTGATAITGGTLRLDATNPLNAATSLTIGNAVASTRLEIVPNASQTFGGTTAVTFYGTTATSASNATILIGAGGTLTLGGNLTYNGTGASSAGLQPASITGAGSLSLNGTRTFTVNDSSAVSADEAELTILTPITSSGAFGITKSGNGNLALMGDNIYTGTTTIGGFGTVAVFGNNSGATGATTVNSGRLILDYSLQNNSKIAAGAALSMLGGQLILNGNSAANTSQTVLSTTFAAGGWAGMTLNPGAGQQIVLNLNALTRAAGAGTVRFNLPSGTQSATNGFTTDTTNTNGLLGSSGFATVTDATGTWFARNLTNAADGNIVPFISTDANDVSAWSTGLHATDTGSGFTGTLATTTSINSLRFNADAASAVTIGTHQALGLLTGGILQTSNVASGLSTINGGKLTSGAGNELIFTLDSLAQALEVSSSIAGIDLITKSGNGTLRLTGDNTSSGVVRLHAGTLELTGGNAIGDNAPVTFLGVGGVPATLSLLANQTETIGTLSGGSTANASSNILLGTNSVLTINQLAAGTYSGLITGGSNTTLVKTGALDLTYGANSSTSFTGTLIINQGQFRLAGNSTGMIGSTSIFVNNPGSQLHINHDNNNSPDRVPNSAVITLNNTAPGLGLFFRDSENSAGNAESIGAVSLGAGHNVIAADYTGTTSGRHGTLTVAAASGSNLLRSNNATSLIVGRNLGGVTLPSTAAPNNSGRISFANPITGANAAVGGGGVDGTATGSIFPFMIGQSTTAAPAITDVGNSFVRLSAQGLRPLSTVPADNEYIFNQAGYNGMAASTTNNVRFNTTPGGTLNVAGGGTRTINALAIDSTSGAVTVTGPASDTLALTAGAILSTGAAANNTSLTGFAGITTGTNNEYIVFVTNNQFTLGSPLTSAAAALTKSGAGTLVLSGLGAGNTYTAGTFFNQGLIEASALLDLGPLGALNFFGGGFRWATGSNFDLSARTITLGAGGGVFDTNGENVTFANAIGNSGGGGLTKTGLGTLTLNGVASYTGATSVSNGTLVLGISNGIGTGALTVSNAATFDLDTFNATVAGLTLSAGAANTILGTGTLTVNGQTLVNQGSITPLLAGSMNLIKQTAAQSVTLSNAASTFTGYTHVQNGILAVNSVANEGSASSLGAPTGVNATIRLGNGTTAGTLAITSAGTAGTTNRLIDLTGTTGGGIIDNDGTAALVLNGGISSTTYGSKTLTLAGATTGFNNVVNGNITNGLGTVGVTKTEAGTWVLGGTNSFTGNVAVNGGILSINGSTNNGTGTTGVGSTASSNGLMVVSSASSYSTTSIGIGGNASGIGSLVVTGGTFATTSATTSVGMNTGNAGYGGIVLDGGTITTRRFETGSSVATSAIASIQVKAGTLNISEYLILRNYRTDLTITGGAINRVGASNNLAIAFQGDATTFNALTVAGGLVDNTGRNVTFGETSTATSALGSGALNLNGGTLRTNLIQTYNSNSRATSAVVNFNGGILQATANSTDFIGFNGTGGSSTMNLYVNGAFGTFDGGAVIDSNGFNVTLARPLMAPTGNGVNALALSAAGSGYTGAPYVEITGGGGTGATGYAVVDLDPASATFGQVTNVVLTNPGVGYTTTPTVTLIGGGGSGAASTASGIAANVSGGLTKTGNGTLTLAAVNTFSGPTLVTGGTVSVGATALPDTSSLTVRGGATFDLYQDGIGAAFVMANNANLTLGDLLTGGTLGFQLGAVGSSDTITLSGSGVLSVNAGGGVINIASLSGFGPGTYDLVTSANPIVGGGNLSLGILPSGFGYLLDYATNNNVLALVVSSAAGGNLWWTGDVNSSWSQSGANTNWSTLADGSVDSGYTPGASNTVRFSAANASTSPLVTTLDSAVSIEGLKIVNSLNAGVPTGAVTIAPGTGGTLTVGTGGIEVEAGAPGTTTISAPLVLGGVQTFHVADAGSVLNLTGVISGGSPNSTQASPAANTSFTITGAGVVAISNTANTFTGDIVVNGGGLQVSNDRSWGGATAASSTSKTITLTNGGRLLVAAGTVNPGALTTTNYNLVRIGTGGGIFDIAIDATLQLDDAGQLDGSGDLIKRGAGTLIIRNQTTYPGNITIQAGLLQMLGATGGFGNTTGTTTISSGAALNLAGQAVTDTESLFISGTGLAANPVGVITNSSTTASSFAGSVTMQADSTIGSATTGGISLTGGISGPFTLTNSSTGTGTTTISSIGADVVGIVQSGSNGLTITGAYPVVTLASGYTITNSGSGLFTLSGGVGTGTGNLVLNANSTGGITLGTTTINHVGTITNSGSGTNLVTISTAIGANVAGLIQNSLTSDLLLSAANPSFNTGIFIKAGSLRGATGTAGTVFGAATNVITLGDTDPSNAPATLIGNLGGTSPQAIVLGSGTTGVLTITSPNTGTQQVFSGGITGANDLVIAGTNAQGITFSTNPINFTGILTARGTGAGAVTVSAPIGANVTEVIQDGSSLLILSGVSPAFTGPVTITSGRTVQLGGSASLPGAPVVISSTGILNVNANASIGGLNGGGTVANTGTLRTLTLAGGGTYSYEGVITATTPANLALTKTGSGTQTLTGQNLYTGATTVNQGTLRLDFAASALSSNILSASSPLVLGGGTLSVIGNAVDASTQTFASTALTASTFSQVSADAGTAGLTVDLSTLTRGNASGLNISLVDSALVQATGSSSANGVITDARGIAFVTLDQTDWAGLSGSDVAAATYATNSFASPASNVNVTGSGNWTGTTVNTLRFNTGAPTLTLSGVNALSTGGLLVGSGAGTVTISGTGTLSGSLVTGTVAAPVIGELNLFHYGSSPLTIASAIVNNATSLSHLLATPSGTAMNLFGGGTVILSSNRNAYSGGTNIVNGTLRLGATNVIPDGDASPGAVTIAAAGTLDLNGFSERINGLAGSGSVNNSSASAVTLGVGGTNAASTFSGVISNSGGGALSLVKTGTGTLTLTGANTYTGATTLGAGGLTLNFTAVGAPLNNIIAPTSALNIGSALLTLTGSTTANAQTFASTTLSGGARITIGGTTPAVTLNLGTITRASGSRATVNLTIPATAAVATTSTNDATGILGGWAVVNSADFATVSGGNLVAYTGYTAVAGATGAGNATQNALFQASNSINAATVDFNTIKLAAAPSFAAATNILRLGATGAILMPTGLAATIIGSAANNGVLTAGGAANTAGELHLINWSANALTVNSTIANNGSGAVTLVKSGSGGVTLAGTNTYSGGTVINQGTLTASALNQLGTTAAGITLNGGTLTYSANDSLGRALSLGAAGGTLNLTGAYTADRTIGTATDLGTTGTGNRVLTLTGGTAVRRATLSTRLVDGDGGATSLVLSFGGDDRPLRLATINSYTGTTTITRGVLDFTAVTAIPGGLTSAASVGNIIFGATGTQRALLQSSIASPVDLTRSVGYGNGQIHWQGNGGFSNNVANTTWVVNLGGAADTLIWGQGGFVPNGSRLQFGVASITNSVTNLGGVDFQNSIDLGDQIRIIDVLTADNKLSNNAFDAQISGSLQSVTGGGLDKFGSGVLVLSGVNNTSSTIVNLTAGGLVFTNFNAVPGIGASLNLSTVAGGNSFIGLEGDTNPIASLGARITNPLTATSAFAIGADSSETLDFSSYPNMRLTGFSLGSIATLKPVSFTGSILPAADTYLFGGAQNGAASTLVLPNWNTLTGSRTVDMTFGNLTIIAANDFSGGTVSSGNGVGNAAIGIGSNSALGTGTVTLAGVSTRSFGAINGDRLLANNIDWAGGNASWVAAGDSANDSMGNTNNGGMVSYLGTITISSTQASPNILSRTNHQVLLLGDITNAAVNSGLTFANSIAGLISLLSTADGGGVAKSYTGLNIINDNTTLIIDHNDSLGAATNGIRLGSGTGTSTLRVQPGVASVTLGAGRDIVMRGDSNQVISVGRNSVLTINGVISGGTNTAARTFTKADNGILVLTNINTYAGAASNSNSLVIRGGTLQLDSANFTAAANRFFPDASNPLAIAFSATTGTYAGGGTLEIIQAASNGFALTQGFGNPTFNTGANVIRLTNNSATQGLTLNLGSTFTRAALLGATVNFATTSAGGTNTIGSTVANANGILGGYATFNGVNWATQTSGSIVAFSGYNTSFPGSSATSADNYSLTGSQTITASQTINSLKFAPASSTQTITVNSGVTQTVTSGGLLFDNTNGSATITGAGQWGATGSEVMVHTWGSGDVATNKLTLNGVVKGAATVISKSGSGTLVLSGNNTYTGALIINAGTVEFSNGGATGQNLGSPTAGAGNILLNGGTLRPTATGNLIFGMTVNGRSALDVPTGVTLTQTAQGITGNTAAIGVLEKTGAGTLTFAGTTDNPNLSLEVTGGIVNLGKSSSATVHSVGLAAGSAAAGTMGAALLIGNGATVNITGTGGDQIHDQASVVVRTGGVFNLGGGSAMNETFDSLAGGGSVTNTGLTGTFNLTLGASNNVNVAAYSLAAAAAGVASTGLNHFTGVISDGSATQLVALTKIGSGTQILSGANTYSGNTTITAGTLQMGAVNTLPSGAGKGDIEIRGDGYGASTINGGTAIGNANRILAIGTLDLGGFNQSINGLNSSTGGAVVNNPTLAWNGSAWVAANVSSTLTLGNGDASGSFNGALMNGYTVAPGALGATGHIGVLALTKVGAGTQALSGVNTYSGVTTFSGGTLIFQKQTALYNNTPSQWTANNLVVHSGATAAFNVGGAGEFTAANIAAIQPLGSATGGFQTGSRLGLDTSNAAGVFTYGSVIADTHAGANSVGLVKLGTGALNLTAANTFTGGTQVSGGTLLVNNTLGSATGSGDVSVAAGSALAGSGIIASTSATTTVAIQGLLDVGNAGDTTGSTFTVDLAGGSSLFSLGGVLQLDLWSGLGMGGGTGLAFSDLLSVNANTIDLTGSTLKLVNSSGLGNAAFAAGDSWKLFDWNSVAFTGSFSNITSGSGNFLDLPDLDPYGLAWDTSALYTTGHIAVGIPEPSRALLLLLGLLTAGLRRRRSQS